MTLPITLAPPNLALAPDKYDRKYEDLAANIHDKFYKQISNNVNFILNNAVFNEATTGTTGTWKPILGFGPIGSIDSTGIIYIYVAGEYQLIGDYVLATWQFLLSSKGTATGGAYVRGLPFPTDNFTVGAVGLGTYAANMVGLTGSITVYPASDPQPSTDLPVYQWNPTGIGQVFDTNFTDTSAFYGGVIYPRF